ncbi:MAG: VWA domain-containing protein [Clostridia bacterium]|nr:VWA domain-containing protein [Clostridia bacterium]
MSFYYPLGLLGLLGIPIVILIYIIKSKYTEQTIASTYLWELSEKFLKKRKPVSKLTGILALILEILAIFAASLLIAHPVFTVKNSANDIYFILDGSASMNMQSGGKTRFERAQDEIIDIIDDSLGGSTYTLFFVSGGVSVAFEGVSDKEQAKTNVKALNASWTADDCASAITYAQTYFEYNRSGVFYLLTDKQYETENITPVNVSKGENNYAIYEYGYKYTDAGLCGTGKVIAYNQDTTLTVEMLAQNGGEEVKVAQTSVEVKKGEPADFEVQAGDVEYTSLRLRISNGDALGEDNTVVLYDEEKSQDRKVLIVNNLQDVSYLRNAMLISGKAEVEVVSFKAYTEGAYTGYDLYAFNGCTPATLPTNAAIWLINAVDGTGKGSGITFRDMQIPRDESGPNSYYTPRYTKGSSTQEKRLMKGIIGVDVAVREYARYGVPRSFVSVMKVGGDSLISAGLNENNDREVVFAFEIGKSNLGMLVDFNILISNLMNYSIPSVIDQTIYSCGDVMEVNVVPGCQSIVVTTPSGRSTTLDTLGNAVCEVNLTETGTYTLSVKDNRGETKYYAYACVPEEESRSEGGGIFKLTGEKENVYSDGFYDSLLAFFIIISLLLLADWGVYCYEQYQLR